MPEDDPQRVYDLREVFPPSAIWSRRYLVQTGCQRRMLPHNRPDGTFAYQRLASMLTGWLGLAFLTLLATKATG